MLAFIVKYWAEFLLGVVAAGATAVAKYFYNLYKKEKENVKQEEFEEWKEDIVTEMTGLIENKHKQSDEVDGRIINQLAEITNVIETLRDGMLSIQGKQFKQECRELLQPDCEITIDEWTRLNKEHDVYNSLNGNHEGDLLFNDVEIKYHSQLQK